MKVIKLSASWCGPCRTYAPIFHKVSQMEEFKDIEFEEIDVEENSEIAEKYGVRNIPCTLIFNNLGDYVARLPGLQTEEDLYNKIRELCLPGNPS